MHKLSYRNIRKAPIHTNKYMKNINNKNQQEPGSAVPGYLQAGPLEPQHSSLICILIMPEGPTNHCQYAERIILWGYTPVPFLPGDLAPSLASKFW